MLHALALGLALFVLLAGPAPIRTPGVRGAGGTAGGNGTLIGPFDDGGPTWTTVTLGADQTVTNSTTMVATTLCVPTTSASQSYETWARIVFEGNGTPGATPGIRWDFTGPAGPPPFTVFAESYAEDYDAAGVIQAANTETICVTPCVAPTNETLGTGYIWGLTLYAARARNVVATGNICFRFANQTATPGGTTTLKGSSTLSYRFISNTPTP